MPPDSRSSHHDARPRSGGGEEPGGIDAGGVPIGGVENAPRLLRPVRLHQRHGAAAEATAGHPAADDPGDTRRESDDPVEFPTRDGVIDG